MEAEDINRILRESIAPNLLEEALEKEEIPEKQIFKPQLLTTVNIQTPPLEINDTWQLSAFGSGLKSYKSTIDWNLKDNWGSTPAHYVVWSGNKERIEWMLKLNQDKQALTRQNKNGQQAIHFAAWSGNPDAIEIVLTQMSLPLNQKGREESQNSYAAPYSAVASGLDFMMRREESPLTMKDKNGRQAIHYAAWSGQYAAIDFILQRESKALNAKDNTGRQAIHYAACSGNEIQLNKVFKLAQTTVFDFNDDYLFSGSEKELISETLQKALETNFALTKIHYPSDVNAETKKTIDELLKRNLLIVTELNSSKRPGFISGFFSRNQSETDKTKLDNAAALKNQAYSLQDEQEKQSFFKKVLDLSKVRWSQELNITSDELDDPVSILTIYRDKISDQGKKKDFSIILTQINENQSTENWKEILVIINLLRENSKIKSSPQLETIMNYFKLREALGIPGQQMDKQNPYSLN